MSIRLGILSDLRKVRLEVATLRLRAASSHLLEVKQAEPGRHRVQVIHVVGRGVSRITAQVKAACIYSAKLLHSQNWLMSMQRPSSACMAPGCTAAARMPRPR